MQPNLRTVRARARSGGVAIVIAIGVFASIATSGIGIAREVSEEVRVPLYEFDEVVAEDIRFCVDWRFSDARGPDATFELTAKLLRASADTVVPIELRLGDQRYRAEGVLDGTTVGLTLRLTIPAEETAEWVECSPWAQVRIGPAAGDVSQGSVEWQLGIAAEILTSGGFRLPWEDDTELHIERRP